MEQVFISIAGNIEPEIYLPLALEHLTEAMKIVAISPVYRTPAIGRPEQPDYLNGVILAETDLPPRTLKFELLRGIEAALGRERTEDKYAAREIDLDMLLYGDQVIEEEGIDVPDPDLRKRIFLAAGVLALAPALILPDTGEALVDVVDTNAITLLRVVQPFTKQLQDRVAALNEH